MHLTIVAVGWLNQHFKLLGCGPLPNPFTRLNAVSLVDGIDKIFNDAEIIQNSRVMG